MTETKYRIDDIVLEASLEVAKQFECAVCLHVAQEPVVQTPCGHVYCKECLAPCSLCPQCREPFEASTIKLLRDVNKMGMRMMQAIKVHCPHGKFNSLSEQSGATSDAVEQDVVAHVAKRPRLDVESEKEPDSCEWKGSYGDLLSKHVCECPLHPVLCPQGCGQVVPRGKLASHRLICERSYENCEICGDQVPVGGLHAHNQEKALQHVEILAAKLRACESAASEQDSLCTRLARVEHLLKGRATTAHVSAVVKMQAEEVKAIVKSSLVRHAEWQIESFRVLRLTMLPGQAVSSPKFCLGGIEGFQLRCYPKGKENSTSKLPVIQVLNEPGSIKAILDVSIGSTKNRIGEPVEKHVWESRMFGFEVLAKDLPHPDESLTVEIALVSAGHRIKL